MTTPRHRCTECGEVFPHIIAYEYHECTRSTVCGYCWETLTTGTHSPTGCNGAIMTADEMSYLGYAT